MALRHSRRRSSIELLGAGSLGLLLALPALPALPGGELPAQHSNGRTLTLRTWNVGDGRASAEQIAAALALVDADVICLQELATTVGKALEPLVAEQYPYHVFHSLGRDGKALLSRWPILSEKLMQPAAGHNLQRARIDFNGTEVLIYNVHPSASIALLGRWSPDETALLQAAVETARHPCGILAGDFNLTPLAHSYTRIEDRNLRNAFAQVGRGTGFSFPLFGRYRGAPLPPFIRIDHVWVSDKLAIQSGALGQDGGSDHRPLDVVLLVP